MVNTRARFNLVNMDYHQSFAERHPKLVLKVFEVYGLRGSIKYKCSRQRKIK